MPCACARFGAIVKEEAKKRTNAIVAFNLFFILAINIVLEVLRIIILTYVYVIQTTML